MLHQEKILKEILVDSYRTCDKCNKTIQECSEELIKLLEENEYNVQHKTWDI
jgi:uncharacterized protein with PIN domain